MNYQMNLRSPFEDPETHFDTPYHFKEELKRYIVKGRLDKQSLGVVVFRLGALYEGLPADEQHRLTEGIVSVLGKRAFAEKGRLKPSEYACVVECSSPAAFSKEVDDLRKELKESLNCNDFHLSYRVVSPHEDLSADAVLSELERQLVA